MWICTGYQIVALMQRFGWALIPPSIPDLRPVCTTVPMLPVPVPVLLLYLCYRYLGTPKYSYVCYWYRPGIYTAVLVLYW